MACTVSKAICREYICFRHVRSRAPNIARFSFEAILFLIHVHAISPVDKQEGARHEFPFLWTHMG